MERLSRLDHLRAISALMVVAWHFAAEWPARHFPTAWPGFAQSDFFLLSIFRQGATGVSFFCVISGFILTTIYLNRDYSIQTYYRNRFLRIAPLFVTITALSYYVGDWDLVQLIATNLTGLSRGGLPSYIGPGWTVLIEFQFYLIFPFLLNFSKKYGLKYLFGFLLVMFILRFAVWADKGTVQLLSYYSIFGRMDQFLVGMIAGTILKDARVVGVLSRPTASLSLLVLGVGTALVFFWWYNTNGGLLNLFGQPWPNKSLIWVFMPLIEASIYAVIICGYLYVPSPPFLGWVSALASYVGVISYSIYLNHLLLFPMVFKTLHYLQIVPHSWPSCFAICVFVAFPFLVAISSITYYAIERPFMHMRKSNR